MKKTDTKETNPNENRVNLHSPITAQPINSDTRRRTYAFQYLEFDVPGDDYLC